MKRVSACALMMISCVTVANTPPQIENVTAAQRAGTKLVDNLLFQRRMPVAPLTSSLTME